MKRIRINLTDIANRLNLLSALHKAARAKRHRTEVSRFFDHCDDHLNQLAEAILSEHIPYGKYKVFQIFDPKPRLIHAACFEDRIFHYTSMNLAGPVLEKP